MCLVEFIVKYVLFIVNLAFSVLGLAIIGLGIAVLVTLSDLNEILPINVIPISMIVLGGVVFLIALMACCGAVRESQCMIVTYAVIVSVLAGLKIWLTVVIFTALTTIQTTVDEWIRNAFNSTSDMPAFHVLELTFRCCGTTGADSYGSQPLPPTCCGIAQPEDFDVPCSQSDAFVGCSPKVTGWFETFGGAVGAVLLVVIIVEVIAVLFSLFFCNAIRTKRRRNY